mmetsp:Transcript_13882/g.23651  ORF Transcript_13882/g.23651 Transcript_13882/m.23651 type:complete len:90 (-) Transcript_13882:75-344(-)
MLREMNDRKLRVREEDPAPWLDNLGRHLWRQIIRPICYFFGGFEVFFSSSVQGYYDCATWLDVGQFAYQETFCIFFFCDTKRELWNGVE